MVGLGVGEKQVRKLRTLVAALFAKNKLTWLTRAMAGEKADQLLRMLREEEGGVAVQHIGQELRDGV